MGSLLSSMSSLSAALKPSLKLLISETSSLGIAFDAWLMQRPENTTMADDGSFRSLLDKLIVRSLLGIQRVQKTSGSELEEEKAWTEAMEDMIMMGNSLKTGSLRICLKRVEAVLASLAGLHGAPLMLTEAQDAALVVKQLSCVAESVQELSVNALLNLTKLLSVILKVFSEIAVHGFCPVKDMDDEGAKSSDEFKSSEEETGLGQGEGAKDVSDQIENEDMLDGAYQNPEDGQDKENKEEDNGIEMSENFDSNLQDKNEEEKGEEEEEDKEGDLEDESGEVEGNEDLDKDMWGDEEEEKEDKSELEDSEEKGNAEEENMDELAAKEDIKKSDKNDEKRQRKEEEKEKEKEPQEFDDNQTDAEHEKMRRRKSQKLLTFQTT